MTDYLYQFWREQGYCLMVWHAWDMVKMFEDFWLASSYSYQCSAALPHEGSHIVAVAQRCWFPKFMSLLYPSKFAPQLGAMNGPKNPFWDAIYIYISRFFFSSGSTNLLFWSPLRKGTAWLTKDGYGVSSNAFRSRSSGSRMECSCRILSKSNAETMEETMEYHQIFKLLQALVLLSCQHAHVWCVNSFRNKKRYMIFWYCIIYHNVIILHTDCGISSAWQRVVKVLLST